MKKGIEMKNWEDLSIIQKLIIGVAIIAVAVIAPEIAMLLQFGGIEVAFAFLVFSLKPVLHFVQNSYSKLENIAALVVISWRHSASARPAVFALQASFCFLALAFTGSSFFAVSFFMPGLLLNGALV